MLPMASTGSKEVIGTVIIINIRSKLRIAKSNMLQRGTRQTCHLPIIFHRRESDSQSFLERLAGLPRHLRRHNLQRVGGSYLTFPASWKIQHPGHQSPLCQDAVSNIGLAVLGTKEEIAFSSPPPPHHHHPVISRMALEAPLVDCLLCFGSLVLISRHLSDACESVNEWMNEGDLIYVLSMFYVTCVN